MRTGVDTAPLPYACPKHGPIPGLGVCWTDGCMYDARVEGARKAQSEVVDPSKALPGNGSRPVHQPKPAKSSTLPDKRTEKEIERAVAGTWTDLGFMVWKVSQPRATMQAEGLADLFVTGYGRCLWCEVKRPLTGRPSEDKKRAQREEQARFQEAVEWNGGTYLLVRSETDVIEWWKAELEHAACGKPWLGT